MLEAFWNDALCFVNNYSDACAAAYTCEYFVNTAAYTCEYFMNTAAYTCEYLSKAAR